MLAAKCYKFSCGKLAGTSISMDRWPYGCTCNEISLKSVCANEWMNIHYKILTNNIYAACKFIAPANMHKYIDRISGCM